MEKRIITITICILGVVWSFWGMVKFYYSPQILNLGITEQQHVYDFEPIVYLDDKPLPPCSEDIETRICTYSCAPDGLCIFVPREIMDKYKF